MHILNKGLYLLNKTYYMKIKNIRLILIVLVVIAAIYGITNHQEHLAPYLPFAFLLGCLVMHLFMHHGGHGHNHDDHESKN